MSFRSEFIRLFNEMIGQSKKISELPAGSFTTSTLFEAVENGVNIKLTGAQISGGPAGVTIGSIEVDTSGDITLDFEGNAIVYFTGDASFAGAKNVTLDNETASNEFYFEFEITNVAAVLTFPNDFFMADVRWDSGAKTWTPLDTGVYRAHAFKNFASAWRLEISQAPYV